MAETLTPELLAITPGRYRELVRVLSTKLRTDPKLAQEVARYLAGKINDRDLAAQFADLSEETRIEACLENIIIGLTAGALTEKEIKNLLNQHGV